MRNYNPLSSLSDKISLNIHNYKFPNAKKVPFKRSKINCKAPKITNHEMSENSSISASDSSSSRSSHSIAELEEPFERCVSSMFDYSIGLNSLVEVLDTILSYLFAAAICDHSYKSLQHLLNSSLKCAPDIQYLVISIAILVLKEGVPPKKKYWMEFSQASRTLSQTKQKIISFGKKQNVARRNLIYFSGIFIDHQSRVSIDEDIDHNHYGIDIIIDYVLSQGKGKQIYRQWNFPDPSPNSIKRYYHNNDENNSQLTNINNGNSIIKKSPSNHLDHSFLDYCSYISNSDDIYISSASATSEVEEENVEAPKKKVNFTFATQNEFEIEPVNDLTRAVANLFSNWSTAYMATKKVWDLLKIESEFDLESLYRILPFAYSDFLRSALKTYEENGDPI